MNECWSSQNWLTVVRYVCTRWISGWTDGLGTSWVTFRARMHHSHRFNLKKNTPGVSGGVTQRQYSDTAFPLTTHDSSFQKVNQM